jgi:hypothetical protein
MLNGCVHQNSAEAGCMFVARRPPSFFKTAQQGPNENKKCEGNLNVWFDKSQFIDPKSTEH